MRKMSATAFETKGIIGHGWKFSESNPKANPGKGHRTNSRTTRSTKTLCSPNEALGVMEHGPAMVNLLSVRKIRSFEYVREDAKTTNPASPGSQSRATETDLDHQMFRSRTQARAQNRSEPIETLPAAHW